MDVNKELNFFVNIQKEFEWGGGGLGVRRGDYSRVEGS